MWLYLSTLSVGLGFSHTIGLLSVRRFSVWLLSVNRLLLSVSQILGASLYCNVGRVKPRSWVGVCREFTCRTDTGAERLTAAKGGSG